MKYHDNFFSNSYYHIYNHAVGNENLFRSEYNYYYFLRKYAYHIYPVVKTIAYNLLPNHFHFLIKVRNEETLLKQCEEMIEIKNKRSRKKTYFDRAKFNVHEFVMQQFSNLFNGYTKAYNIQYVRKGALFLDYLKRKQVKDEKYLINLIAYIHYNAVHHGLTKNVDDWKFSSYQSPLTQGKTKVEREEVLKLFETKEAYIKYHQGFKDMMDDDLEFL